MDTISQNSLLDFRAELNYGLMSETKLGPLSMSKATAKRVPLATDGREAYRLWFEFLKIARASADKEVCDALKESRDYYAAWDMDHADRFEPWWKAHTHLFRERYFIRELSPGEMPKDPKALVLEIPLIHSPTVTSEEVAKIVAEAYKKIERKNTKTKKTASAHYKLTEGSEPRTDKLRILLNIYREVYQKTFDAKGNPLKGKRLIDEVRKYKNTASEKNRKNLGWLDQASTEADDSRAQRNLRRDIGKVRKIILNVARGEFPGKYG